MAAPLIIADFTTQLSVAIAVGGTTASMLSNLDDDGVSIPTAKVYLTLDGNNSNKECISCTNTAGSLTAIKTVSRQGTETSGAARAHRVGCSVVMTDWATYKSYIDAATVAGISPSTTTLLGGVYTTTNTASSVVVSTDDTRLTAASMLTAVGNLLFPVGAIWMSIVNTSPTFGTWIAWGSGKVPVGVDTGQTEFNTVEKTGGEKTHLLTVAELAAHTHTVPAPVGSYVTTGSGLQFVSGTQNSGSTGSDTAHNNLQPYLTCYMFKRTA